MYKEIEELNFTNLVPKYEGVTYIESNIEVLKDITDVLLRNERYPLGKPLRDDDIFKYNPKPYSYYVYIAVEKLMFTGMDESNIEERLNFLKNIYSLNREDGRSLSGKPVYRSETPKEEVNNPDIINGCLNYLNISNNELNVLVKNAVEDGLKEELITCLKKLLNVGLYQEELVSNVIYKLKYNVEDIHGLMQWFVKTYFKGLNLSILDYVEYAIDDWQPQTHWREDYYSYGI